MLYSNSRFLIKNNCPKIFDESQKNLEMTKKISKILQGYPYTIVQIVLLHVAKWWQMIKLVTIVIFKKNVCNDREYSWMYIRLRVSKVSE